MMKVNGKEVPGVEGMLFNMSFANSPSVPTTEHNLFVNNIPVDLNDAALYLVGFIHLIHNIYNFVGFRRALRIVSWCKG